MDNLIKRLAQARQIHTEYKEQLAALEAEIQAEIERRYGHELERVRSLLDTAKLDLEDADANVRRKAYFAAEGGNMKPHPAVQVKVYTTLTYDDGDAIEYCTEHHRAALRLDRREFEKVVKVLKPGCVTIGSELRPTVASNLSKYLEA